MRQAVISAVYVDLDSKTAYANYIVISGVPKDWDVIIDRINNEWLVIYTANYKTIQTAG